MQPSQRILFLLLSVCLIFCLCPATDAFAVPWPSNHNAATEQEHSPSTVFPQLIWLRNTVIEKLFGVPPKGSQKKGCHKSSLTSGLPSSKLPASLLTKYGGDVVLRFNLTTPAEEAALAEAADDLFLDVWEFTDNWADIRLGKDDVRSSSPLVVMS